MLKKLNYKSATGADNIKYLHFKHAPANFKNLIIDLFNLSIDTSTIPETRKTAKIIMILKPNKPPNEISSYRPISLTSCFAKLLEKFLQTRLINHLNKYNIISKHQSGFRAGF
jgi:hypothetical protein